jgi:hypothetical protein
VVSHSTPDDVPEGGVYTFINGIVPALEEARTAAGDKDVTVMQFEPVNTIQTKAAVHLRMRRTGR